MRSIIATTLRRQSGRGLAATIAALALSTALVAVVSAGSDPIRPIRVDQTDGFGNDRLVVFTYSRNYDCITQPFDDLDSNGTQAATDPNEFQTPHCIVGRQPTIDPNLRPIKDTAKLWVLVPFFDADADGQAADGSRCTPLACSGGLAKVLHDLFGIVPDAFDPTPGVPVQCPEPGLPLTQHTGAFGTCTMHPIQVDLGPLVATALGLPAGTPVMLPTPNHSHLIDGANFGSIWWHIQVVLVLDQAVWPGVDGTTGINSVAKLRAAQAAGKASGDITTNFFLPFDSRVLHPH